MTISCAWHPFFVCHPRYISVPFDAHVTFLSCSGHIVDKWEPYRSSCYFVLLRAGCGLQNYMDDITDPLSQACLICDVIVSTCGGGSSLWLHTVTILYGIDGGLVTVPIELGQDASAISVLELTSQNVRQKYHLSIYFTVNHFTA